MEHILHVPRIIKATIHSVIRNGMAPRAPAMGSSPVITSNYSRGDVNENLFAHRLRTIWSQPGYIGCSHPRELRLILSVVGELPYSTSMFFVWVPCFRWVAINTYFTSVIFRILYTAGLAIYVVVLKL